MQPVLQQIVTNIEQHVPQQFKDEFDRIVLAGKKILFDPKFHQNMQLVKDPQSRQNPVDTISTGVTGLMWLLYMQSGKKLSTTPLIMAGAVFMADVFDFASRAYNVPDDNDTIAETWKMTCQKMFQKLGVKPEDLQAAIDKNSAQQQPATQPQQSGTGLLSTGGQ